MVLRALLTSCDSKVYDLTGWVILSPYVWSLHLVTVRSIIWHAESFFVAMLCLTFKILVLRWVVESRQYCMWSNRLSTSLRPCSFSDRRFWSWLSSTDPDLILILLHSFGFGLDLGSPSQNRVWFWFWFSFTDPGRCVMSRWPMLRSAKKQELAFGEPFLISVCHGFWDICTVTYLSNQPCQNNDNNPNESS